MNLSLQRVLMDFAQDDPPTPRSKESNKNGKPSNGWWIWTCEVTSTRSITTYSWVSCKRKLETRAFFASSKLCSTLASLQDWTYHPTYSGVPQGSIVSPILANIYLHELDQFMKELKEQFDQGKRRKKYPMYHRLTERIRLLRKKADRLRGKEEAASQLQTIQEEIRQTDRLRKQLPSGDPFD